jgi:hypothetical protein
MVKKNCEFDAKGFSWKFDEKGDVVRLLKVFE